MEAGDSRPLSHPLHSSCQKPALSYLDSALAAAPLTGENFREVSRNPWRCCYFHGTQWARSWILSGIAGTLASIVTSLLSHEVLLKRKSIVTT